MTNQTLRTFLNRMTPKASAVTFPLLTFFGLILSPSAHAALLNAGFEDGFDNWDIIGDVSIDMGSLGIEPPFADAQALLTTASLGEDDFPEPAGTFNFSGNSAVTTGSTPELETFLGLSPGALDTSPFLQAFEGSAIVQSFTVEEDEEDITVAWNFLTNDSNSTFPFTPDSPKDYAFMVLDGEVTILADTSSSLMSSSTTDFNQETGSQSLILPTLNPGVHTLAFGIIDIQDNAATSALLIDVEETVSPPPGPPTQTSEPTSKFGLFLLVTLGAISFIKKRN